jgi:hypothetical protein
MIFNTDFELAREAVRPCTLNSQFTEKFYDFSPLAKDNPYLIPISEGNFTLTLCNSDKTGAQLTFTAADTGAVTKIGTTDSLLYHSSEYTEEPIFLHYGGGASCVNATDGTPLNRRMSARIEFVCDELYLSYMFFPPKTPASGPFVYRGSLDGGCTHIFEARSPYACHSSYQTEVITRYFIMLELGIKLGIIGYGIWRIRYLWKNWVGSLLPGTGLLQRVTRMKLWQQV